jgi:tRNA (guanine-N7-)-methyltransferase
MSVLQKRAYETLYASYCIDFRREELDLAPLFPGATRIIMEIGFGMGLATAELAEQYPQTGFLCTEVFTAGVGKLLSEIEKRKLANVRIIQHDAFEVLTFMVPQVSLHGMQLFFPDPWPKKRHHKRRLVNQHFLELAREKLVPEGYLYIVTDWEDYARSIVETIAAAPGFENPYGGCAPRSPWRPTTRYEKKALRASRPIHEIWCRRKPGETTRGCDRPIC